jgi:hypothetical protein
MDQAITGLLTTSFLVFSIVVAIIVSFSRTFLEFLFRKLQFAIPEKVKGVLVDFWRESLLRAFPVIVGGLLAFYAAKYPFPSEFSTSVSGRVFFGLIAGLFSSTIYSFAKFHVNKYVPDEIKSKMNPLKGKLLADSSTDSTADSVINSNEK